MKVLEIVQPSDFGYDFIAGDFLPNGENEYYIRNRQNPPEGHRWRALTYDEVATLRQNGNSCDNWADVWVEDPFDVSLITNCFFAGLVRIGVLEHCYLRYHDFVVPAGITNSKIISCDIGENCAIHDCAYLSHYIIRDRVILSRVDEMSTTNHSKFGEGLVKDGEDEAVRVEIETINEAGGRSIYPFVGMTTADAYLWARHREDGALIRALENMTQQQRDASRGYYGEVGVESVIKSSRIIKDVNFGDRVYVKGANKLKNLTVRSRVEEPTQIGEGVELVNGIIGFGSRVFYGVKAVRFVLGNNCELKYGTRFLHSVLGDNSTISCCEVLHALIFPFHEQHHNNSFLIAAMVQGQSNMAAGATIGSNHNTRGNDGEIVAGRGFWPGLSATLKHNCRFASFVLISKGNYAYEMHVPFPFSLVIHNESENRLEVMPAYYWMYNMYALERNNKKFVKRDKRKTIVQHIESNSLAPDSVSEIFEALALIEDAIKNACSDVCDASLSGRDILETCPECISMPKIPIEALESAKRPTCLLRAKEAWFAYREMLLWYGVTTLAHYLDDERHSLSDFAQLDVSATLGAPWVNLGGQLMPEWRLEALKDGIKSGCYENWEQVHQVYHEIFAVYEQDKAEHAYAVLCSVHECAHLSAEQWNADLAQAKEIRKYIEEQIFYTKNKDYENKFRSITYRNDGERDAVLGHVKDNAFIQASKEETIELNQLFDRVTI